MNGKTFPGFKTQNDVDFESEWGMASTIADLRAVLAKVPADQRQAHVVLAGHSLGATIATQYAAWDFEGRAGHEELAGLVLIDGVTGDEGKPLTITQAQYETSGVPSPMGTLPSLSQLRVGTRYFAFPLLESTLFPVGLGTAMRASWNPDIVEKDVPRAQAFQTLFLMDRLPRFTNRGAFGLAFDAASCPVSIAAVNAGQATGGALTSASSPCGGGTVLKPTELGAPVLVEAAAILSGDVAKYEKLRAVLPPVSEGRPSAGASRQVSDGFQAIAHPGFSHIDPVAGTDVPGSESAAWFDSLVDFMKRNTREGGVVITP